MWEIYFTRAKMKRRMEMESATHKGIARRDISNITKNCHISRDMFGISEIGNMGVYRKWRRGIEKRKMVDNEPAVCIFTTVQKRNEEGPRKRRNYREQTSSRNFGHPEYIMQMEPQLGRDLGNMHRGADTMDILAHGSLGGTFLSIAHQAASTRRRVNISECPCNE